MTRRVVPGGLRPTCICQLAELVVRAGRRVAGRILSSANAASRSAVASIPVAPIPMEPLEGRQLLAGVTFTNGTLVLSASDTAAYTLSVAPSGSSNLIAKANGISKTVAKSSVKRIEIYGGAKNDTIRIDNNIKIGSYIDTRAGNDYVSGGGGNDTVYGDTGNDTLYGNAGNDSMSGESGNDIVDGGSGTNTLSGGTGSNVIKNGGSTAPAPSSPSTPSTTSSASVSALELWDAGSDKKLQTLTSGATIDLAKLPSSLTLVAQGSGASVKFGLDSNTSLRVENGKPWAIAGDISGNLVGWTFPTGTHTIKLTPFTKQNGTGTAGAAKSFTLNIKRSTTSTPAPSAPSTPNTPSTGTSGVVPRNNSAATPNAVITAVSNKTIHAGQSIHVHATSSGLGTGSPLTARYAWDFGDPGSSYNTLLGFNAAHVYEKAGTYTVKLTLSNEAGKTDTATMTVTVQSAGRKVYYVSNSGSDSNAGTSSSSPLKTFAKAKSKVGDNVEILFAGGQTFDLKEGMTIYRNNVVIGSYGSGKAVLKYSGPKDYTKTIYLGGEGHGERMVRDLVFDSTLGATEKNGAVQAVGSGGKGDAIVNNEFRNVGVAVNANARPTGLLVQDNDAPNRTGLKEYFVWAEGSDLSLIGNYVANTLYGHDVRSGGTDRMLLANNTFVNPTDAQYGDSIERGTINMHIGNYLYVANNTLTQGIASVGPLGRESTGLQDKGARIKYVVLEGNTINDSRMVVLHGTEHVILRNNVINLNNDWAIEIEGYDSTYGRGVVNATIVNNTAVNTGTVGNFLRVGGDVNGINLINNLYLAPKLITGNEATASVLVFDNDLASFSKITGNVWAAASPEEYAQGGQNYVWSNWSNQAGYKTATEWANYGVVIDDKFSDVAYSGYTPSSSSVAANAGIVWAGVFTDKNGKMRSSSGSWSAGAVEV